MRRRGAHVDEGGAQIEAAQARLFGDEGVGGDLVDGGEHAAARVIARVARGRPAADELARAAAHEIDLLDLRRRTIRHRQLGDRPPGEQAADAQHEAVVLEAPVDLIGEVAEGADDVVLHHAAHGGIERLGKLVLAVADLAADGADDERGDGAGDLRVPFHLGAGERFVEHRSDAGGKSLLRARPLEHGVHACGQIGDRPRLAVEQQLLQS